MPAGELAGAGADPTTAIPADAGADPPGDPYASPTLTTRERAILSYVDRVTAEPSSVTGAHIEPMREAGLDDRAIHDVCAIAAYYAFVNRTADGLGVELEADRTWKDGA